MEFEEIHKELMSNLKKINKSLVQPCISVSEEFRTGFADKLKTVYSEGCTEHSHIRPRVERQEKKYFFFGPTSAGKSSLVNAFLKRSDLPNRKGRTTNCFIQMKRNLTGNDTYFQAEGKNEKFNVGDLSVKVNETSEGHFPNGTRVELFYSREDCPTLDDYTVIIDTPGIDTNTEIDSYIVDHCQTTDVIVLVINSVSTTTNNMKTFIEKSSTIFSRIKLFLIFNFWDEFDEELDRERSKESIIKNALEMFNKARDDFEILERHRIFFVSSKEQMKYNENNILVTNELWKYRNNEFQRFLNALQMEMGENTNRRRYNYLERLYEVQKKIVTEIESVLQITHDAIPKFVRHLNEIEVLKNQIKDVLEAETEPIYDKFIKKSLYKVNKRVTNEEQETHPNFSKDEIIQRRITTLLEKFLHRCLTDIKERIIELTNLNEDQDQKFITKIYFPFYLEPHFPNIKASNISAMNKKGNITNGCCIIGVTGITGVVALRIGMKFVAKEIIKTGIKCGTFTLCSGGIIGGLLMMAGVGHTAATLYKAGAFKSVYEWIWKSDEANVQMIYNEYIEMIRGSYSRFLENFENNLSDLFNNEEKNIKLNEIKVKMNEIRTKMNNFEKFVPK